MLRFKKTSHRTIIRRVRVPVAKLGGPSRDSWEALGVVQPLLIILSTQPSTHWRMRSQIREDNLLVIMPQIHMSGFPSRKRLYEIGVDFDAYCCGALLAHSKQSSKGFTEISLATLKQSAICYCCLHIARYNFAFPWREGYLPPSCLFRQYLFACPARLLQPNHDQRARNHKASNIDMYFRSRKVPKSILCILLMVFQFLTNFHHSLVMVLPCR